MNDVIFPEKLKKGSKIGIISPAGYVEPSQLESTLKIIRDKGYETVEGKYVYGKYQHGYPYSGTEKERISDLNWALNDPDLSAIWASRGGYGCQHLLRYLKLSGFRKNPKWYVGYSDNTVIQSFLLKKGFASIHGQTVKTSSFGVDSGSYEGIFQIFNGKKPEYQIANSELNRKGRAEGQLIGGNLALIYALLGSSYSFKFKDRILFIEEIGENYYALDRMLMSLDLAGVFRQIKGLIIGGMINMGKEAENPEYESSFDSFSNKIISERISKCDFPVIYEFPNGHIYQNHPLIIGANISMEVGKKITVKYK